MAEDLNLEWFNLKNYDAFKTMSLEEWGKQIEVRRSIYLTELDRPEYSDYSNECEFDETEEYLLSVATKLKSGVLIDIPPYFSYNKDKKVDAILSGYSFSTASVDSLSSSDLLGMAKNNSLNPVWNACENMWDIFSGEDPDGNCQKIADTPHDFNILLHSNNTVDKSKAHVVINLLASDDQIKKDFSHWLTNYREILDIFNHEEMYSPYTKQKLFSKSHIDHWVEFSVIPYIDLILIAKIERKKKPTFHKMGCLLFPFEFEIDLGGRVRQVTQEAANLLLTKDEIYSSLSLHLISEQISGIKKQLQPSRDEI